MTADDDVAHTWKPLFIYIWMCVGVGEQPSRGAVVSPDERMRRTAETHLAGEAHRKSSGKKVWGTGKDYFGGAVDRMKENIFLLSIFSVSIRSAAA